MKIEALEQPAMQATCLRFPATLWKQLKIHCVMEEITALAFVTRAIETALKQNK